MRLTVEKGELLVLLGKELSLGDAARLDDTVRSLDSYAHLSRVTVDFSEARDFQYASLAALARTLCRIHAARICVRGLSLHQTCILQACVEKVGPGETPRA